MSSSRSSFASGTIFGIILGVLVGHFGIWRGVHQQPASVAASFPVQEASLPGMSFDLGKKSAPLPYFPEAELRPIDDYPAPEFHAPPPETFSPLANAIAMETVEVQTVQATKQPAVVNIETPAAEPQPLAIEDAAPIEARAVEAHVSKNDVALRNVIEEELIHIPENQRDVWFESLKDMHVDDAQGVIRMWKLIGGPIPGLGEDSFMQPPTPSKHSLPLPKKTSNTNYKSATTMAINHAIGVVRRNLIMESTPGYMRIVPRFSEELIDGIPVVSGIIEEIDFSMGKVLPTNRILDLFIEGLGFFEVMDAAGNVYLTRRGRFSLNEKRQLAIIEPDGEYVLQPPVVIPEETQQIQVETDGKVSIKDAANKLLEATRKIQIVRILSTEKLTYHKNGLFEYSGEILIPTSDQARTGMIHQGMLEASNVDLNVEKNRLQRLEEMLDEL